MVRVAASLLIGLIAGFAAAMLSVRNERDGPEPFDVVSSAAGLADRLDRIETSLAEERRARLALQSAVDALRRDADRGPAPTESAAESPARQDPQRTVADDVQAPGGAVQAAPFRRNDPDRLTERFIEAGLPVERAEFIVRRTEALRLEALEARYEALRSGSGRAGRLDIDRTLREELGDADYEKYRSALGRPTDVRVASVLASSPAAQAGFRDGDRIVGYAGRRIYDMPELTQLTLEGAPGESVVVDIVRDGQPMQLVLPRGPLGITGGGRYRRRP